MFPRRREGLETLLIGPGDHVGRRWGQRAGVEAARSSRVVWFGVAGARVGAVAALRGVPGARSGLGLRQRRRSVSAGGARDGPAAAAAPLARAALRFGAPLPSLLVPGQAEERVVAVAATLR